VRGGAGVPRPSVLNLADLQGFLLLKWTEASRAATTMSRGKEVNHVQDAKKALEQKLQEDLEIVELYEKLDMTFDPLSALTANTTQILETNCNNNNCC
jgi:hypothetical protein